MRFDEFEKLAWSQWEKVPAQYQQGISGLTIDRDAKAHPDLEETYTLGECVTEAYLSDYGGPDTTRSAVVLYYGSFLRLSHLDANFDWEKELWETLTHELQHHLEALAAEDSLADVDYAVDQNYKRLDGEPFDPLFFRAGEPLAANVYRVEDDVFIESAVDATAPASFVEFQWEGARYRLVRPTATADVCFVRINGGPDLEPGELWVVLVPRRGVWRVLGDALRRRQLDVSETEATAEPLTTTE